MKGKKPNLNINTAEIAQMQKRIDGLRFIRQNLHISPQGLIKMSGQQIPNLLPINQQTIQICEQLGKGAACVVERGIYTPLNLSVAVKSINVYDQGKRHQTMNDIRVLYGSIVDQDKQSYRCQFIVSLLGAYYESSRVRVVLQLMDEGSLQNIIGLYRAAKVEPVIDEGILTKVVLQMLCGLTYLHSKNVLHRDIKPANVLLSSRGEVKLSDFGISRQISQEAQFSKTSVGTRSYMSPQRIQGGKYSFKSDVWGIGLIIYELATGKFPYDSKSQFDLRRDFQKIGTPQLPNHYSDDFQDFIDCSLAVRQQQRSTASQLLGHRWLLKNLRPKISIKGWLEELREDLLPLGLKEKERFIKH